MRIFRFVKKVFFLGLPVLTNLTNVSSSLNFISMKNQERKTRPQVINVNINNPIFYLFSIKISNCSGCYLMIHMQKLCSLHYKKIKC